MILRIVALLLVWIALIGLSAKSVGSQAEAPVNKDECAWIYDKAKEVAVKADSPWADHDEMLKSIMWSQFYQACRAKPKR